MDKIKKTTKGNDGLKQSKITSFIKTRERNKTFSTTVKNEKDIFGTDIETDSRDGDFDGDDSNDDVCFDDLSDHSSDVFKSEPESVPESQVDAKTPITATETAPATANAATKQMKLLEMDEMKRYLQYNSVEVLARVNHSLLPAWNVGPGTADVSDLRTYPNCLLSPPHPVYVATKHADRIDVCHLRTIRRENYRQRLVVPFARYHKSQKWKKARALEKRGQYHRAVFDIAERLELNPDPYFYGSYDYYYTGGNLCVLPDSHRVLHAGGDNLQDLHVSEFSKNGNQLQKLSTRHMFNTSEIFEIQPLRQSYGGLANCFALRQRNSLFLGCVRLTGSVKGLTYLQSDRTPFISFAQSPVDDNALVVTSLLQHMRWYDLNAGRPFLTDRLDMSADGNGDGALGWNIVRPWRKNNFLYANTKEFFVADLRSSPKEWRRNVCGFANAGYKCDNITGVRASKFDHLVYVATSHKLHCLDMRYSGRHFEDCTGGRALCRWTHQLGHAPAFMDSLCSSRDEWVAMASPLAGDISICELTHHPNNDSYESHTLAYQPPTVQEAYEHARLAGNCLQPEADLRHRIRCCTTGLTMHNRTLTEDILLTSNSNGDVFVSRVSERTTQDREQRYDDVSDAMMASYAGRICELAQRPLHYTEVVDLKAMRKVFRCVALDGKVKSEHSPKPDEHAKPKRRTLGRWQKSMHALHTYKDALAADLLAVWDIDYEKEGNLSLRQIDASVNIKTDPAFKVNEWLAATAPSPTQPMTSIPAALLNTSNATELTATNSALYEDFSGQLNSQVISTQNPQAEFTVKQEPPDVDPSQPARENTTQKPPRKKTKYVKGF